MKKHLAKKLSLAAETLRRLDGDHLGLARGAQTLASVCDPRGGGAECSGQIDCTFSCYETTCC